jgi:hypothetical protein
LCQQLVIRYIIEIYINIGVHHIYLSFVNDLLNHLLKQVGSASLAGEAAEPRTEFGIFPQAPAQRALVAAMLEGS